MVDLSLSIYVVPLSFSCLVTSKPLLCVNIWCAFVWRRGSTSLLDAFVERSCTCPVCQQQGLEPTLKKKRWLSHHWPGWSCLLSNNNNEHVTLCYATELLDSIGSVAPELCGLQIISWPGSLHTSLLDFLTSSCFCGSKVSRMLFGCLFYT